MFSDHLATTRSVQVLTPPHLGEDGSLSAKKKPVNEPEELHPKGTSQTLLAQSSSGENTGEDGSLLATKKTTNEPEELHLEGASRTVPAHSSSKKNMGKSNTETTSYSKRKILLSLIFCGIKGFTMPCDVVNEHVST